MSRPITAIKGTARIVPQSYSL